MNRWVPTGNESEQESNGSCLSNLLPYHLSFICLSGLLGNFTASYQVKMLILVNTQLSEFRILIFPSLARVQTSTANPLLLVLSLLPLLSFSPLLHRCDLRRAFITGFTGSAGCAVISTKEAALFTDGRYFLQAGQQLEPSVWTLMKQGEPNVPTWQGEFEIEIHSSIFDSFTRVCYHAFI